jgi:hypothetical protein
MSSHEKDEIEFIYLIPDEPVGNGAARKLPIRVEAVVRHCPLL